MSFFKIENRETPVSRWARARTRAAKVGKGLSKDEKAQKLALQHWLEAVSSYNFFKAWNVLMNVLRLNCLIFVYRLIQDIDMDTIYTSTMMFGQLARAHNLSSTGNKTLIKIFNFYYMILLCHFMTKLRFLN